MNIRQAFPQTFAFIALGALLVFHYVYILDYPAPSCDEAFYGRSAVKFFDAIVTGKRWVAADTPFFLLHGRLYWLVMGTAFSLFGTTLFTARMVSFVGLVLLMLATFLVGKRYVNRNVGLWSAVLVAATWLSMYSGHQARPDMLAAAFGALSVTCAKYALDNRHWSLFMLLGLLLVSQIEIHPLTIHIGIAILVMLVAYSFRKKVLMPLGATVLGMLVAGAVMLLMRYGIGVTAALQGIVDNNDQLVEFVLGSSPEQAINLLALPESFLGFWWDSYAWFARFVSIPQAILFLVGLLYAYLRSSAGLRPLASLVVISSVSFALINSSHSWLGYSLLWIPYYMVMGVAAVVNLRVSSPWNWLNRNIGAVILVLYSLIYMAGDVYLVSKDQENTEKIYLAEANQLLVGIPSGALVLAKQYWWYAMLDKVTFLDEHLIAPRGTLAWWIGVPNVKAVPRPYIDDSTQIREQFEGELQPDFVIMDGVLGCKTVSDANFDAFLAVVQSNCELKHQLNSRLYRMQQVYQCVS